MVAIAPTDTYIARDFYKVHTDYREKEFCVKWKPDHYERPTDDPKSSNRAILMIAIEAGVAIVLLLLIVKYLVF